jgi:hypothetical protein
VNLFDIKEFKKHLPSHKIDSKKMSCLSAPEIYFSPKLINITSEKKWK